MAMITLTYILLLFSSLISVSSAVGNPSQPSDQHNVKHSVSQPAAERALSQFDLGELGSNLVDMPIQAGIQRSYFDSKQSGIK